MWSKFDVISKLKKKDITKKRYQVQNCKGWQLVGWERMIRIKRKLQSSARGRADIPLTKHKTEGVVG